MVDASMIKANWLVAKFRRRRRVTPTRVDKITRLAFLPAYLRWLCHVRTRACPFTCPSLYLCSSVYPRVGICRLFLIPGLPAPLQSAVRLFSECLSLFKTPSGLNYHSLSQIYSSHPQGYALPLSTGSQKDLGFRRPHSKLQPTGGRALKGKGEESL